MASVTRLLLFVCLFAFIRPVHAAAQFETATVLGTVKDPAGSVVPSATVVLESPATGIETRGVSDELGQYQFFNVKIGSYRVRVEAPGFKTATTPAFEVTINARQRVDLSVEIGQAVESITVVGAVRPLETDSSDRGHVISAEAIVNLPLNGRSYADLALLTTGARESDLSDSRDASFNINGQRSSQNNFIVDGVDNNAYGTSNQGFSNQVVQLSPDAVAEFRVQTNNYSAEFGRAGGAVVNASVRSGSNQFHGAIWEYLRNTALNATGFFKPTGGKPVLIQNQFGGTLGGPIVKNRYFFFADYEGYRRISRQLTFATIPTMEQRDGILGIAVRNPVTGEEFPNGVVPISKMTSFARKVLTDLPEPNVPGIANNFSSMPRRSETSNKIDFKVDAKFSDKWNGFLRYSYRLQKNLEPSSIPGPSGGSSNGNVRILNWQWAWGTTYTLDASSLLELRLGAGKTEGGKTPLGTGLGSARELYGITGLPENDKRFGGLPSQSISGIASFGIQSSNPQYQNPLVINPKVNYSKILRSHTLKAGYEYQAINTDIDDFHPKYGSDSYSGQFSKPVGVIANNNLYNLADFYFGTRSSYSLNNPAEVKYRQRMHFLYLQDDVHATSNLTLNLGLRYDFATPQWEAKNRLANFDPATRTLIMAKDGSIYDRALVHPDKNNFAPRVGFAYNFTPRTVVRSSYGISYIHFNRMGGENILSYNGPFVIGASVNQLPTQGPCGPTSAPTSCFRTTQEGYPTNLVIPENFSTLSARVNYIPANLSSGYVQSWHLTVQRELAEGFLLDVAYVGNRGVHLMILGDYNQGQPNNPGGTLTVQQRRPIQGFSFIQIAYDGGVSSYNGLAVKLERKYSRGLYFLNSFTWSKAIDNAAGHLEALNGDNSRANYLDLKSEKGVSSYDQPFNNTTSLVWEIPYGVGRRFGSNVAGVAGAVLGGWRLSAINSMTSGSAVNLSYSPVAAAQVGSSLTYRPNLLGDPSLDAWTIDRYFDPDMVVIPTDITHPFGNAGRNIARAPGRAQLDLGIHKVFSLGESRKLEFRSELFNAFNHTNFGAPAGNRSSANFGTIRSTRVARQAQFALKLMF